MAELRARMSQAEFHEWGRFYARYPFDDFNRYHRPAALIAQVTAGGDIDEKLNWLQPQPRSRESAHFNEADMNTFRAFGVKPPLQGD